MSIKTKIMNKILQNGDLSLEKFMETALLDEEFGYYTKNNPFGTQGDFITSPEISQTFGEVIAFWIIEQWFLLGNPPKIEIIELGAGRGTLQTDILRILSQIKIFICDFNIHIIESNNTLQNIQKDTLSAYKNIFWYKDLKEVTITSPTIIITNEFFDALPIRQFTHHKKKWYEMHVTYDAKENQLLFINKEIPYENDVSLPKVSIDESDYFVYETSPTALNIFKNLLEIIKEQKGAILTIDYGNITISGHNSFRGFKNHKIFYKQDILNNIENMDLTANVNFKELSDATPTEFQNHFTTQKELLEHLGIQLRLDVLLKATSDKTVQDELKKQVDILINKDGMGTIFKALIIKNL